MEEQKQITMTKEQYENRFEQLKNAIMKLQREYIEAQPIKVGDDVMVYQTAEEGKKGNVSDISATWYRKDINFSVRAYKKNGEIGEAYISTQWGEKIIKL